MKKCKECNQIKEVYSFYTKGTYKNKPQSYCKECVKKRVKKYAKKNKNILRIKNIKRLSIYRKNNREILRIKHKIYNDNHKHISRCYAIKNKDKIKIYIRNYSVNRRKKDPKYKLNSVISSSIGSSLRKNKGGRKWINLVGYNLDKLKSHLENQFDKNMNWNNHGTYWHIDHIIPISKFNFTSAESIDFKRCWSLDNLRPLEKFQNLSKYNKLLYPLQPTLDLHFE